jgi:hypothetical protein
MVIYAWSGKGSREKPADGSKSQFVTLLNFESEIFVSIREVFALFTPPSDKI